MFAGTFHSQSPALSLLSSYSVSILELRCESLGKSPRVDLVSSQTWALALCFSVAHLWVPHVLLSWRGTMTSDERMECEMNDLANRESGGSMMIESSP